MIDCPVINELPEVSILPIGIIGALVGAEVGASVGADVIIIIGEFVGWRVGELVGAILGASVIMIELFVVTDDDAKVGIGVGGIVGADVWVLVGIGDCVTSGKVTGTDVAAVVTFELEE